MGKIYYIMGKSATGKDTVFKRLMGDQSLQLKTVVMYTTRPPRSGEKNGVEYFFCSNEFRQQCEREGRIIEWRVYHTIAGPWYYFTLDDGQIDLDKQNYLMIGTLESYEKMRDYYGGGSLVPVYIQIDDGLRLWRAWNREKNQKNPQYAEVCRRYLADDEDFCEQKLRRLGINEFFENDNLETCCQQIKSRIQNDLAMK